MYTPRHFAMDDARARELLGHVQTAQLITAHETGPQATLLPVLWRPSGDAGWGSLVFHVTRVNPVWRDPGLGDALAILSGPDGYLDPTWFDSYAEAPGVPTWNYITLHARGPLVIHDDPDWSWEAAQELSLRHGYDAGQVDPASRERMLRAIVGVEMPIRAVEAKEKLSQNRSPEDIRSAVAGLRTAGQHDLADAMEATSLPHAEERYALMAEVRGRQLGTVMPVADPKQG